MKKVKRMLALVLTIAMALTAFTMTAAANESASDEVEIQAQISSHLDNVSTNMYLYQDLDTKVSTVALFSVSEKDKLRSEIAALPHSKVGLAGNKQLLADTYPIYLSDKIKYYTHIWKSQNIEVTDFKCKTELLSLERDGNMAIVRMGQKLDYQYTDSDIPTSEYIVHTIHLYKFDNQWIILHGDSNDPFDSIYDDAKGDCDKLIQQFDEARKKPVESTTYIPAKEFNSNMTLALSYLGIAASRYASVYTTDYYSADDYTTNFYNANYQSYEGVDCQNFASQCIRAGFGGSDDVTSINDKTRAPNDGVGGSNRQWHPNPTYHWAWTDTDYFNSYTDNDSLLDSTMIADKYIIGNQDNSFTSISSYSTNLLGAVLHVRGKNGAYKHAVVVDTPGATRDTTYYTAHTSNAKHKKLSASWPASSNSNDSIRVIIPRYFYNISDHTHTYSTTVSSGRDSTCNVSGCSYCRMYPRLSPIGCVPVNSTQQIVANSYMGGIYRMAIKVVSPDNTETWLGHSTENSSTVTKTFKFTQKGLNKVTVYARDLPESYANSKRVSYTMCVRVY